MMVAAAKPTTIATTIKINALTNVANKCRYEK